MSAGAHRLPPRRHGVRLWSMRFFGLVATGALLAVGAIGVLSFVPESKSTTASLPAAPAATPKPAHKKAAKKHAPAKPKLTAAQRAARTAAVATLSAQGYRAVKLSDYSPTHVVRVLIGKGDGGQRAFFFAEGRYIGNDTADDSDSITVVRAGNRSVSLAYKLRGGSTSRVLFRWDGKKLTPQTAIPPYAARHAV